jgi:hypothetical protein
MANDESSEAGNAIYINGQLVHSNTPVPAKPIRKRWTPPELDPKIFHGPKLKIKRAKQHLAELNTAINAFHESGAYEIIHEVDSKSGESVYRIRVHKEIPCDISTIIGDIVHNLRSSLDQVVCDLVRANKKQVRRGTGFPISRTAKHFETNSTGKIQGVSPKARRLIERL